LHYTGRIMRWAVAGFALALGWVLGLGVEACFGQAKSSAPKKNGNACAIVSRAEAEAVVGAKLQPAEVTRKGTVCRYLEPGYDAAPAGKKHVTIDVYESDFPNASDVNQRLDAIDDESSQAPSPAVVRELPEFADGAIWVWSGGSFGGLDAFKGGTVEVGIRISGIAEEAALAAAKKFAARALKGTGKTGFLYNPPEADLSRDAYNGGGMLKLLYGEAFGRIPDDALTRAYVVALVQGLNGVCPKMAEMDAVMDFGFYSARKANKAAMNADESDKAFGEGVETLRGGAPDVVRAGNEDAATFFKLNAEKRGCANHPIQHLYNEIAELALERKGLAPDVDDDAAFLGLMSSAMKARYKDGFVGRPSVAEQGQLQKLKDGCVASGKDVAVTGSKEGFCRCEVAAAKDSKLGGKELEMLGERFTQATLTQLGARSAGFQRRELACFR
jgi:hypothetical protein